MKEYLVEQYFALTKDHWTSCANESYMAATLHYIDDAWILRSLTLNCAPHTGETTGVLMAKLLKEGWESLDLRAKQLVAVVTDTAANMTAAGWLYPSPLIYCAAHTLADLQLLGSTILPAEIHLYIPLSQIVQSFPREQDMVTERESLFNTMLFLLVSILPAQDLLW